MVPTFGWKARRLGVAVGKGYLSRQTASQNAGLPPGVHIRNHFASPPGNLFQPAVADRMTG